MSEGYLLVVFWTKNKENPAMKSWVVMGMKLRRKWRET